MRAIGNHMASHGGGQLVPQAGSTRAHATFDPNGRSVSEARRFVRDTLVNWDVEEVVDDAVLLVSELVTNAVVHAGTMADVTCMLYEGGIQVEVRDRHPTRGLPGILHELDPDREGGRGLLLSASLASAWGVRYTSTAKDVWFRLDLPSRSGGHGTTLASPIGAVTGLPVTPRELVVASVIADSTGTIRSWSDQAAELFGWSAEQATRLSLTELLVWPPSSATGLSLEDILGLARWQGEYSVRHRDGSVVPVFASHVRALTEGDESIMCLIVHRAHRAVLEAPAPTTTLGRAVSREPTSSPGDAEWVVLTDSIAARLGLDELLQRTVERARDALGGDAAYVLLATDDETELEVRATTGLPPSIQRATRIPAGPTPARIGSTMLPAVHEDLADRPEAAPLLRGTGMRALITVPLLVEGRVTGTLGVAATRPGQFDNEEAIRLQRAADRIALAVESARLAELERARRGWLSFLAEASDLLAGTLDHDMALALVAQLVVPRLATWCAVHTVNESGATRLAYVWHADETRSDALRELLEKAPPPEPRSTPGAYPWSGLEEVPPGSVPDADDLVSDATITLALVARGRSLGSLTLGRTAGERFRRDVIDLAEDLSRRAALALDNARVYSERAATSHALQRSLLPQELPDVPGADLGVVYQAAGEGNEVGGDFYDVFAIGEGRVGVAVGDVCGKGAEAAAVTGLARHALRILAAEGHPVPEVLNRLNALILAEGNRSRFLTLIYGEVAPRPGGGLRLRFARAGHPPPMLLRPAGEVESLGEAQPLLGVLETVDFEAEEINLSPRDVLVCYTDGVTERRDGAHMLGEEGLAKTLAGCRGLTAKAVAARIQRAVVEFAEPPPRDDVAVLVVRTL